MTPLTPSRVPLLLETTKVTKPACSAAKIRGRTVFCHGEAPDWVFWRASAKVSSGKFRSIDFSGLPNFQVFPHEIFVIPLLLTYKTQKLTKTLENSKAKCLTNVNQGVQIYNIWYSSDFMLNPSRNKRVRVDTMPNSLLREINSFKRRYNFLVPGKH